MRLQLTDLSMEAYQTIGTAGTDFFYAIDYLRSGIQIREFMPTLQKLYSKPDLKDRLIHGFLEANPSAERSSIVKKIQNWINRKNVPVKREDIFILCFALHLSEEDTSYLLGFVSDYGIHYRSPRELAYSYCLRSGKTYPEAVCFYESLADIPCIEPSPAASKEPPHTSTVCQLFRNVTTDQEFREEYTAHLADFGTFHQKAFETFSRYYSQLSNPYPDNSLSAGNFSETTKKLSVEDIMADYLSLGMPSGKKRKHLSSLQKLLKDGWPNATLLFNILNRKENVSRKLLILLYLVTQNILDTEYSELDEDYLTPQERLDEHKWTLDSILDECGMNTLDPRSAYDWLVLYSLYTEPDEDMDERMKTIIQHLFPEQQGGQ